MKLNLFIDLFLVVQAYGAIAKKPLPNSKTGRFTSTFSPENFCSLVLTCKSFDPF